MRQKTFEKCGWRDPVQVLRGLTGRDLVVGLVSDGVALRGRWSYIAAEPSKILQIAPGDRRHMVISTPPPLSSAASGSAAVTWTYT
jgi:hypothetical protein